MNSKTIEIKNRPERILEAAIWYKDEEFFPTVNNIDVGTVITGFRHHIIIQYYFKKFGKRTGGNDVHVQGFSTSKNRFVDREEARKIALERGQIDEKTHHETDLFSEDLY